MIEVGGVEKENSRGRKGRRRKGETKRENFLGFPSILFTHFCFWHASSTLNVLRYHSDAILSGWAIGSRGVP